MRSISVAVILLGLAPAWAMTPPPGDQFSKPVFDGCEPVGYSGRVEPPSENLTDLRGGAICHFRVRDDIPVIGVRLYSDPAENVITHFEVFRGKGGVVDQRLESGMGEPPYKDAQYFQALDLNFDGYKDIRIMTSWGATGNTVYKNWLYEPKFESFDHSPALDALSSPTPDPKRRVITTRSNGGMAGCIYTIQTYDYFNGQLRLIWEESQVYKESTKSFEKTVQKFEDGYLRANKSDGQCENWQPQ